VIENAAAACDLRKTMDNEFTHDRSTFPQTFTHGLSENLRECGEQLKLQH
jgi:hypothetical protein